MAEDETDPAAFELPAVEPKPDKLAWWRLPVAAVILVVILGTLAVFGPIDFFGESGKAKMWSACKEQAASELKSPSTASFSPLSQVTGSKNDDDIWTLTGWVDSQNSFGATVRNRVLCIGTAGFPLVTFADDK